MMTVLNWEWSWDVGLLVCVKYAIWLVLSSTYHFLTDDSLHADKDQQESLSVAGKLHVRCRCKIRHISKFTAASRGSPCDSTAFLSLRRWFYSLVVLPYGSARFISGDLINLSASYTAGRPVTGHSPNGHPPPDNHPRTLTPSVWWPPQTFTPRFICTNGRFLACILLWELTI